MALEPPGPRRLASVVIKMGEYHQQVFHGWVE
jgi:hypothetical protein